MMMSGRSSILPNPSHPFTAAQWKELELQALFFKLMVSGHPIPPQLIFSINGKTSFTTHTQPQHIGICFELGSSRKTDPEPSRCRRTDGKKWRCSRQTFGDSKYCERHMHRGKSRPRKFVESKPLLQVQPHQSASGSAAATQSNLTSLSSVTTCDIMKPVKDSNLRTLDSGWSPPPKLDYDHNKSTSQQKLLCNDDLIETSGKRQRVMYHQFIEESPHQKSDSWLSLVI